MKKSLKKTQIQILKAFGKNFFFFSFFVSILFSFGCVADRSARRPDPAPGVTVRPITPKVEYRQQACPSGTERDGQYCKCSSGQQWDQNTSSCKSWFGQECSSDDECHPSVSKCLKGFGSDLYNTGPSKKVCVSESIYRGWKANAAQRSLNGKIYKVDEFPLPRRGYGFRWKKAGRLGKKPFWPPMPVKEYPANLEARTKLVAAVKLYKRLGLNCSVRVYGFVDRNTVKVKVRHNDPDLAQIHFELAKKRAYAYVLWVQRVYSAFQPTVDMGVRVAVNGDDASKGKWRKAEAKIICGQKKVVITVPGKPAPLPAPSSKPVITGLPKHIKVDKAKQGFSNILRIGAPGLRYLHSFAGQQGFVPELQRPSLMLGFWLELTWENMVGIHSEFFLMKDIASDQPLNYMWSVQARFRIWQFNDYVSIHGHLGFMNLAGGVGDNNNAELLLLAGRGELELEITHRKWLVGISLRVGGFAGSCDRAWSNPQFCGGFLAGIDLFWKPVRN